MRGVPEDLQRATTVPGPWNVGDAGELLDEYPDEFVLKLLSSAHAAYHLGAATARGLSPTYRVIRRWKIRRQEKAACSEIERRYKLVQQVLKARADE